MKLNNSNLVAKSLKYKKMLESITKRIVVLESVLDSLTPVEKKLFIKRWDSPKSKQRYVGKDGEITFNPAEAYFHGLKINDFLITQMEKDVPSFKKSIENKIVSKQHVEDAIFDVKKEQEIVKIKEQINNVIKDFDHSARNSDSNKIANQQFDREKLLKDLSNKLDSKDHDILKKFMKRKFNYSL